MFKRYWWVFFAMVPLGSIAGLLVAAVITYMMPKKYESEAVIEVMPRDHPPGMDPSGSQTPQEQATEVEILKNRKALEQVAANLQLPNRWNVDKETAIGILKGIVETRRINGTDLISIRARHTNRIDARDIAGEICAVYKAHRVETEGRESERDIQKINKMILDQEDKVEERRKVLEAIVSRRHLDAQGYVDAKHEYDTEHELLQQMKLKLMGENISRKMVSDSVLIHDEPVTAQAPISPNITLNLLLGAGLGLLLSPLMALPLMWLLNRARPAHAAVR